MLSPGTTVTLRQKKSEPAFGGCTRSGTRKTQSRQVKSSRPSSPALLPKDLPEVQAQRLLELGAGAGRRLGVLQLVDVELEGHTFPLDAVELRGEPASLVGLG